MKKMAVGAEDFELEAVERPVTPKIIDISKRSGIRIADFMMSEKNRESLEAYLNQEKDNRKKAAKRRKELICKIIKTILWTVFFWLWGSCLIMGSFVGLVAVAVGIIVSVVVSI